MKNNTSIWIALLGVVIGALAVLTFQKATQPSGRAALKVDGYSWRKLNLILDEVSKSYVDTIDYETVTEAAVKAALSKLDPHSVYIPPTQLQEAEEDLQGGFDGIGIQFNVPNDTAIVLEVIPGGPSEKIGLQPGDRLLKVNDKGIAGVNFPQDSMVRRMKGPAGTKVTVTVKRGDEVIPFEITRGKIPIHSIDASFMVNDTTGYIRLSKFAQTTYQEFTLASAQLLLEGMTHLIVDLRENTGGYLQQACLLTNLFLAKGQIITYMEGLRCPREEFKADGSGVLKDIGLSVLIDEYSASSSEIFAGAIQDNDRGVIVGRRSFGKGLVQEPRYFSDGSGLRITIARYYTPSGRCIQKPYSDDYELDYYKRYENGELVDADSIKVDKSLEFTTVGGRKVYGGGGIIPDVFVPMDTTRASTFYIKCNRKATPMRFASYYFDGHKAELSAIEDYAELIKYLDSAHLDTQFLRFAASKDGIVPKAGEWEDSKSYMMTAIRALVGRYSKLGDKAYYHIYLEIDETVKAALEHPAL